MIKDLIIKSSYSKLPDGKLKSNLGDLVRSTVLLDCLSSDFLWLTDCRGKEILKKFLPDEKIIAYEDIKKDSFKFIENVYNIDNYCNDKKIFDGLAGKWFGYISNGEKIFPQNKLIESITPYIRPVNKKSWQENLITGMGFKWENQDYILSVENLRGSKDIGLNCYVHSEWCSKNWSYWKELEEELSKKYSVSWQKGLDNFEEYFAWINSCDLIITGDTFGMHLASALRKKVIAIVGPTESGEFSYGRIKFIKPKLRDCMPCNSPKCKTGENCLMEIKAKQVKEAIEIKNQAK